MTGYSLLGYAIASAIILIIGWTVYRITFENKVKPSISRIAILGIILSGLILPSVVPLIEWYSVPSTTSNITIGSPILTELQIESQPQTLALPNIVKIVYTLTMIYLAGALILLLITITSFVRLCLLKKRSATDNIKGVRVFLHDNQKMSTFSWFGMIFIYKDAKTEDNEALLEHERAHVSLWHWVDLILSQILVIFQWFNPAAWMLRKELQQVHEYQADEKVLASGMNEYDYQMLLIRNVNKSYVPSLTAGFNNCSIKKRLMMMKLPQKGNSCLWRWVLVVAGFIVGIFVLQIPALANMMKSKITSPRANLIVLNNKNVEDIIYHIDNQPVTYEDIKNLDPDRIAVVEVFKGEPTTIGIILKKDDDNKRPETSSSSFLSNSQLSISLLGDNNSLSILPQYEYGEMQLKKDLFQSLNYYFEDYNGTVEVQFTVTATGETKNFKIKRSVSSIIDMKTVMALKELPGKWLPGTLEGKATDMDIVIPFSFNN